MEGWPSKKKPSTTIWHGWTEPKSTSTSIRPGSALSASAQPPHPMRDAESRGRPPSTAAAREGLAWRRSDAPSRQAQALAGSRRNAHLLDRIHVDSVFFKHFGELGRLVFRIKLGRWCETLQANSRREGGERKPSRRSPERPFHCIWHFFEIRLLSLESELSSSLLRFDSRMCVVSALFFWGVLLGTSR